MRAEDCRVRTDSERERENGCQGKARFLEEHARAVAKVLHEGLHVDARTQTLCHKTDSANCERDSGCSRLSTSRGPKCVHFRDGQFSKWE
jgi:hypothetical protein